MPCCNKSPDFFHRMINGEAYIPLLRHSRDFGGWFSEAAEVGSAHKVQSV